MSHNVEAVEATREQFRPKRVMTLFVGESAPASGDFFYYGNNAMLRHMQRAVEAAFGIDIDYAVLRNVGILTISCLILWIN